ncbi:hypothetical protein [Halomarina ordinaria]|uniref:Uncharacterized protein n=1 Tax=Halomarina ordinaria TaxID=3033939 RepID=A0ABD5UA38_9EURY|nr:hypothetical protein [Halomarina sp. PSRA2]
MRAREWTVASLYYGPEDFDIPPLPRWREARDERGRLTLSADGRDEPFITCEVPVKVRR